MKYLKNNKHSAREMNIDIETGELIKKEIPTDRDGDKKKNKKINPDKLNPLISDNTKVNIVEMQTSQAQPRMKQMNRTNTENSHMSQTTMPTKRLNQYSSRIENFSEYQDVLGEGGLLNALAYELDEKGINKVFKDITGLKRQG